MLELRGNAGIIDSVDAARKVCYLPVLWDVNPKQLGEFLKSAPGQLLAHT